MSAAERDNLDRDGLAALLDLHGSDARNWPDAQREAALALVRDDSDAARMLHGARALDAALDAAGWPEPDADLGARIAARAPARGTTPALTATDLRWLRRSFALACLPVALGFLIGVAPLIDADDARRTSAATELAAISQFGLIPPAATAGSFPPGNTLTGHTSPGSSGPTTTGAAPR